MSPGAISSVVGYRNVSEAIRSCSPMAGPDYVDAYTVTAPGARALSPEEWARAVLEETPLGRQARPLWRALGLRLGPPGSPDYVQGWRIVAGGEDWIRVETTAWFATAHAVCHVDDDAVSIALFLQYHQPAGALFWAAVGVLHRRGAPALLRQGLRAVIPAEVRQ